MTPAIEEAEVELKCVLSSATFVRSPRTARLLAYLCAKTLAGRADEIKEYNIAVDLLGRPTDFDPSANASVRVEVHRLRKKLVEYYSGEGADRILRIEIPSGSYVPLFGPADFSGALPAVGTSQSSHPDVAAPPHRWPWRFAGRKPRVTAVVVAGIMLAAVALGFGWRARTAIVPRRPVAAVAAAVLGRDGPLDGLQIRILAGRTKDYTDSLGRSWSPDQYVSGGEAFEHPASQLGRTADPALFSAGREGSFSYDIPLPKCCYEMRLYFAETQFGPGNPDGGGESSRLFNVSANGKRILNAFDILSDAGGANMADVRVFKDMAPASDGKLHLRFIRYIDQPLLNAIELVPSPSNRMNPIRFTMQDRAFRDSGGNEWMPDQFGLGGRTQEHAGDVDGAPDSRLYGIERYGNFNYAIPVAEGSYNLKAYMAEIYWGPDNPGGGGPGTRVFDIYCNGVALARELDILGRVGPNHAFVFQASGLKPNAQGKLHLSFVPVVNYASIFAIEVTDAR